MDGKAFPGRARRSCIPLFAFLLLLGTMILPPPSSAGAEVGGDDSFFFPAAERFSREDAGADGATEEGFRFGLGLAFRKHFGTRAVGSSDVAGVIGEENRFSFNGTLTAFGGQVDYDRGPAVSSTTSYRGIRAEGDLGWEFPAGTERIVEPFAGLRYQYEERDVNNGSVPPVPPSGFKEVWHQVSGKLGVRGTLALGDETTLFGEVGLLAPAINKIKMNVGSGSFIFKPGQDFSHFQRIGIRYAAYRFVLYHETLKLSGETASGLARPESETDTLGLLVGFGY